LETVTHLKKAKKTCRKARQVVIGHFFLARKGFLDEKKCHKNSQWLEFPAIGFLLITANIVKSTILYSSKSKKH
jgi:hypothetical protein